MTSLYYGRMLNITCKTFRTSELHPRSNKVLRTSVHREHIISDDSNLQDELSHLKRVFEDNEYSPQQMQKALQMKRK